MKKLILGIIVVLINHAAFSQTIDLGIKGGINFAKVREIADLEYRAGLQGGIFGGVRFSYRFGIQADILYSEQGGIAKNTDLLLSYVTVPVVIKYYLIDGLNAQIGPQISFNVLHNVGEEIGEDLEPKKTDFSGNFGMGYDFSFGLRLDIRYNIGFSDILEQTSGKNNVFSIALGYSFYKPSRRCYCNIH